MMKLQRMHPTPMHGARRCRIRRRAGVVLLAVLGVLALLSLLGATLAMLDRRATAMTATFKQSHEALYAADSGCHLVRSFIERDLASKALDLYGASVTVAYAPPEGASFAPVTRLTRVAADDVYAFSVTGLAGRCRSSVRVTFRPISKLGYGFFADSDVDMGGSSGIFAYDSRMTLNPTRLTSLGAAVAGSNGEFLTRMGSIIDGDLLLGADTSGVPGDWNEIPSGGTTVQGDAGLNVGRIDPDPLGAVGGELADQFAFYSSTANNQNAAAVPSIPVSLDVTLENGDTLVLRSGAYYIRNLTLKQGATLTVNAVAGPVSLYVTGSIDAMNGSAINTPGSPVDLRMYCNSTGSVILRNSGDFNALLYAPFADVQVMNSGDFRGCVWGKSVILKNSGNAFVDRALLREFRSGKIDLLAWKELRD